MWFRDISQPKYPKVNSFYSLSTIVVDRGANDISDSHWLKHTKQLRTTTSWTLIPAGIRPQVEFSPYFTHKENMVCLLMKDRPKLSAQRTAMDFKLKLQDNKQVLPASLLHYPFVNDPLHVDMNFQVAPVPEPQADVHFTFHKHTLNIDIVFFNPSKLRLMYRLQLFDESGKICFQKENQVKNKNKHTNEQLRKPLGRKYMKSRLTGIFELISFESGFNSGLAWERCITIRRNVVNDIPPGAIQNINLRFNECDVNATNCIVAGSGNTFGDIEMKHKQQQPQQQRPQQQTHQQTQQQTQQQPQPGPSTTQDKIKHVLFIKVWNWFKDVLLVVWNFFARLLKKFVDLVKPRSEAMQAVRLAFAQ